MKFNKWTLGLAAIGVVSLTSANQAMADGNGNYVQTALKGVAVSGYIDTSVEVALTDHKKYMDTPIGAVPFRDSGHMFKQDGFNLNVIELNIEKPQDESPWASGFKVSLLYGPDAVNYNTSGNAVGGYNNNGYYGEGYYGYNSADFAIKNAYVALRTPVGNGIDWKIGVFDTVVGYEVFESGSNPNFTRSWGYYWEPTQHEGILASYKVNENISVSAGVANTLFPGIGTRNQFSYANGSGPYPGTSSFWCKTWMGSVSFTAPDSWGFLSGSTWYNGAVYGINSDQTYQLNYYSGAVINTPITGLTTGVAFDFVDFNYSGYDYDNVYNLGLYASYKATDKLSFHGRGEYGWECYGYNSGSEYSFCWWGLTGTIQYDLWENVISRLEARYEVEEDYSDGYTCGAGLYANFIYKF